MRMALNEAEDALVEDEVPIGAVVVHDNKVIAKGHNRTEALRDATAHAEMLALTAAMNHLGAKYLNECTLYVTIEPCIMCAGALGWAQIGRVVYGADEPKRGYTRFSPSALHPQTKVTRGILADESRKIIQDFFAQKK